MACMDSGMTYAGGGLERLVTRLGVRNRSSLISSTGAEAAAFVSVFEACVDVGFGSN